MLNNKEEVFVVDALRTPFGSFLGGLSSVSAVGLAATVIKELVKRTNVPAENIQEIIMGQVLQGGCGQSPASQVAQLADLPKHISALTVNKVCSSGLISMVLAANSIKAGESQLVIAGGMESMSSAPYVLPNVRKGQRLGDGKIVDMMMHDGLADPITRKSMGQIVEDWLEKRKQIPRKEQDDFASASYGLAQAATKAGFFKEEIVSVTVKTRKGNVVVENDEEPFHFDLAKMQTLSPVFKKGGTVTAGNASTINDGAAVALLASSSAVARYKLCPIAKLVASATYSTSPELFPETDVFAIEKVVAKAGIKLSDVGLFEINEAFSVVVLITVNALGIDMSKVNVNGGAVSIGHPIGASGGRLVATLIREMKRRNEQYGVVALCNGGGEAVATLFELVK